MLKDDAGLYNKIFSQNEFIQTFMKNVDQKHKTWAAEQSPRVFKVFNNDFLKFATDESPMRTARKQYYEGLREERRQ